MSFNPDLSKQTQEVIFSRKQAKSVYPDLVFKAMFFHENLWLQLFVRPHLDYGDFIYDQPNNRSFCQQIENTKYNASLENTKYNASLAITGAIKGISRLKLYNEIELESLKFRRWFRCTFYKIKSTGLPSYLFELIPKSSHMNNTRSLEDVATLYSRTDIFKYSFFPSTIS